MNVPWRVLIRTSRKRNKPTNTKTSDPEIHLQKTRKQIWLQGCGNINASMPASMCVVSALFLIVCIHPCKLAGLCYKITCEKYQIYYMVKWCQVYKSIYILYISYLLHISIEYTIAHIIAYIIAYIVTLIITCIIRCITTYIIILYSSTCSTNSITSIWIDSYHVYTYILTLYEHMYIPWLMNVCICHYNNYQYTYVYMVGKMK